MPTCMPASRTCIKQCSTSMMLQVFIDIGPGRSPCVTVRWTADVLTRFVSRTTSSCRSEDRRGATTSRWNVYMSAVPANSYSHGMMQTDWHGCVW